MNSKRMAQSSKRVLILGINGQLGTAFSDYVSRYYSVINRESEDFVDIDVTDRSALNKIISTTSPDYLINCAAVTNVDLCERDKELAYDVNVNGIKNIISSTSNDVKIIHISTDYIFDGNKEIYTETDPPNPLSYYGKTKLESENILRGSNRNYLIIRTSVIFGASHNNFYRWVLESLSNGKEISVVTDQVSNPTWTWSLSEAIYKSIISNLEGVYHYAGEEIISRYDFAKKIAKRNNLDPNKIKPILTSDLNQLAARPRFSSLDTEKIKDKIDVEHPTLDCIIDIIAKNDL